MALYCTLLPCIEQNFIVLHLYYNFFLIIILSSRAFFLKPYFDLYHIVVNLKMFLVGGHACTVSTRFNELYGAVPRLLNLGLH